MELLFSLKRRSGASAALPRSAGYHFHQTERSEASATARPDPGLDPGEESQGRGCARPAPEVKQ